MLYCQETMSRDDVLLLMHFRWILLMSKLSYCPFGDAVLPGGSRQRRRPSVLHQVPRQSGRVCRAAGNGCICFGCHCRRSSKGSNSLHSSGLDQYLSRAHSGSHPKRGKQYRNAARADSLAVVMPMPRQALGRCSGGTSYRS